MPLVWPVGAIPPGMTPSSVKRIIYPKSPSDVTPITCDFSGPLAAIDNDSLRASFTPQTSVLRNDGGAPDLYILGTPSMSQDLTRITVWTANGSIGYEYLISVTVQSLDGQTITRSFILPVNLR